MRVRPPARSCALIVALGLGGCGGTQSATGSATGSATESATESATGSATGSATESATRSATRPDPAPEPEPEPAVTEPDPDVAEAPDPAPSPREPSNVENNQDYEISDRDCRTLAAAYAEAWRLDETKKIPAGMSPSERSEVENELESSSAEMREQYLGQCRNTVGTAYPYDNLKCAMKAKSMQRFDDCMAGKL